MSGIGGDRKHLFDQSITAFDPRADVGRVEIPQCSKSPRCGGRVLSYRSEAGSASPRFRTIKV
jgi:hypothetical protein